MFALFSATNVPTRRMKQDKMRHTGLYDKRYVVAHEADTELN